MNFHLRSGVASCDSFRRLAVRSDAANEVLLLRHSRRNIAARRKGELSQFGHFCRVFWLFSCAFSLRAGRGRRAVALEGFAVRRFARAPRLQLTRSHSQCRAQRME